MKPAVSAEVERGRRVGRGRPGAWGAEREIAVGGPVSE